MSNDDQTVSFLPAEPPSPPPAYIPFEFMETKETTKRLALGAAVFFLAFIIAFGVLLDQYDKKNAYYAAGLAFSVVGFLLALLRGAVLDHFRIGTRDTTFWRCIVFVAETWCGMTAVAFIVPTGPVASVCLYFLLFVAFMMYSIQRYYGAERFKEGVITYFPPAKSWAH